MARVLVLGAQGMLGQMVHAVLSRTPGVTVLGTARRPAAGLRAFEATDSGATLREIFAGDGPFDLVVNAIGVRRERIDPGRTGSIQEAVIANAWLPHEVAAVAGENGARMVHVSTDAVFAPEAGACFEDDACTPGEVYGQTKALGEPRAEHVLTLRCSLVGPDGLAGHGLLEWLRAQPPEAQVPGFANQLWNGVTTLQLATLCRQLVAAEPFAAVRAESPVHHFCPNQPLSKHELLRLLAVAYRPDLDVQPVPAPQPVTRVLKTRMKSLARLAPWDRHLREAIEDLGNAHS